MNINLSPDETHIILKALEHEADQQNKFVAGLEPGTSRDTEQKRARDIMALFDAIAQRAGYRKP